MAERVSVLHCSFCMFDERRPTDSDSVADLDVIVVINGHSTCLWHSGYAQGGEWSLKLAAVKARKLAEEPDRG